MPQYFDQLLAVQFPDFQLEHCDITATGVSLILRSIQPRPACPECGGRTTRRHSQYVRKVTDLPWSGAPVRLALRVRRFRYPTPSRPPRIFTERLPQLLSSHARRTSRLTAALRQLGIALGGEAGARYRLKLLKRQMYGRANLDLLTQRVLNVA